MGFIRDTIFLRQYLKAKALSDLIDDIEEDREQPKKKRKSKRVQQDKNDKRHLGFWDFIDKQLQEQKQQENHTQMV